MDQKLTLCENLLGQDHSERTDRSKLQQGIQDYMAKVFCSFPTRSPRPLQVTNGAVCKFCFFMNICMALLNVAYVVYTWWSCTWTECYGYNSTKQSFTWFVICHVIVYFEGVIVVFHVLRILADLIIIPFMIQPGIMMRQLIYNLNTVSSFSFLEYLPFPAKVLYWWEHKKRLYDEFVANPPLLQCTGPIKETIEARLPHSCQWIKCMGEILLRLSVRTIQYLTPVAIPLFVLLSLPACAVKVNVLPTSTPFPWGWGCHEWLVFIGVLNQMTKVWNVRHVEVVALFQHISFVAGPEKASGQNEWNEWTLQVQLGAEFVTALDDYRRSGEAGRSNITLFDSLAFLSQLSVGSVSQVLHNSFGANAHSEMVRMATRTSGEAAV